MRQEREEKPVQESAEGRLIKFRHTTFCKAVSCLLIFTFTITNLTYGYEGRDYHLREARDAECGDKASVDGSFKAGNPIPSIAGEASSPAGDHDRPRGGHGAIGKFIEIKPIRVDDEGRPQGTIENIDIKERLDLSTIAFRAPPTDGDEVEGYIEAVEKLIRDTQMAPPHRKFLEDVSRLFRANLPECIIITQEAKAGFFGTGKENALVIYQGLLHNPISFLHEIAHYLDRTHPEERIIDRMEALLDETGQAWLGGHRQKYEALSEKDEGYSRYLQDNKSHYIIRAFTRQVFGEKDGELTQKIKATLDSMPAQEDEQKYLAPIEERESVFDSIAAQEIIGPSMEYTETYKMAEEILASVLKAAGLDPELYRLVLLKRESTNAFVVPYTTRVFVNIGLIRRIARLPAEAQKGALAFVLSHETVHILQYRKEVDNGKVPSLTDFYIWRYAEEHIKMYTNEYGADTEALFILERAGYSTRYAAAFLEELNKENGDSIVPSGPWMPNPKLPQRILELKKVLRRHAWKSWSNRETFSKAVAGELPEESAQEIIMKRLAEVRRTTPDEKVRGEIDTHCGAYVLDELLAEDYPTAISAMIEDWKILLEELGVLYDTTLQPTRRVMEPDYIEEKSNELHRIFTGAPLMARPCTIGIVVRAKPGEDADGVLSQNFANIMGILGGRLAKRAQIERGVAEYGINGIRYITYIDDGSDDKENLGRLKEVAVKLKQEAEEGRTAFSWILSNKKRDESEEYQKSLKSLQGAAHLVALDGQYPPVSWQMLAGPLFANLIYSKDSPDADENDISKIVDSIITSVSRMTMVAEDSEALRDLADRLRSATKKELDTLFNGISLVLYLPDMIPLTYTLHDYRRADSALDKAL